MRHAKCWKPAGDFDRDIVAVYFILMGEARRYCRDDRADDLAAEAVTRALEHRDAYDGRSMLSWCRVIMRNLWLNRCCRVEPVSLGDYDIEGGVPPDVVLESREALSAVQSMCTASVSVDTLVEFASGFSLAEIAARRGIPLGTVKRRIHDGRAMLRAEGRIS